MVAWIGTRRTTTITPTWKLLCHESAKAPGVSATWMLHLSDGARLSLIAGLCNTDALKVPVDSTFSLQDFASALTRSASGRAAGKILLKVSQS
jgi:NADPH:quinone reductase-like Zn-dependent oxidoreductase